MRSKVNAQCVTLNAKFAIMSDIHERLRLARLHAKYTSPTEAARAFGFTVSSYLGYENGDREPGKDAARRIADSYKVSLDWLLTGRGSMRRTDADFRSQLKLAGRIGAGAQIDVDVDQSEPVQIETVLPLPAGAVGFEVVGDSMWPRYDEGDVIVCLEVGTPLDDLPNGDEAAVKTTAGLRYLKRVLRGEVVGLFNLESHNAAPIRGVELDWASEVVAVIRASKWRRINDADRRRLAKSAVLAKR